MTKEINSDHQIQQSHGPEEKISKPTHITHWTISLKITKNQEPLMDVKHSEKLYSVFGGHLIFLNFPPRKWEGYFAYSSAVGGYLHL
jgi:hypothetical protein